MNSLATEAIGKALVVSSRRAWLQNAWSAARAPSNSRMLRNPSTCSQSWLTAGSRRPGG